MWKNITSLNTINPRQASIPILRFRWKNITEDVELIAGNAGTVKSNNVEVAYAIKNNYSFLKRYHEFLGHLWINSLAFGGRYTWWRLLQLESCHMLWRNILKHMLYQWQNWGLEEVLLMHNAITVWWMNVISCHTTAQHTIITNTLILTILITLSIDDVFSAAHWLLTKCKDSLFTVRIHLRKIAITRPANKFRKMMFMAADIVRITTGSNSRWNTMDQSRNSMWRPSHNSE